jgi:hypothetical protein
VVTDCDPTNALIERCHGLRSVHFKLSMWALFITEVTREFSRRERLNNVTVLQDEYAKSQMFELATSKHVKICCKTFLEYPNILSCNGIE